MADEILHFNGSKFRVTGSGSLQLRLIGLDDVRQFVAVPLTMASAPGREPTRLMNFNSQRARLEGKTRAIDEKFRINRIILYVKRRASQYPG
jgi:hypothetical protein